MVISDCLRQLIQKFKENSIENATFEANLIMRHFLKITPIDMVLESKKEIPDDELKMIKEASQRRINNEPIQYILNSQEFMGLDFYVDENVLVPRSDTETLVEYVLEKFKNKSFNALDIGTGSGCIAVSLAHFNKRALVRGIDINENSVEIAKRNAESIGVSDRTEFETRDVFGFDCYGKYELIVSNPPYIKSAEIEKLDNNVKDFEPRRALDGGEDGLKFYRHIVTLSKKILTKSGMLVFEVGFDQADDVKSLMEEHFEKIEIIKDLCGVRRVVAGIGLKNI